MGEKTKKEAEETREGDPVGSLAMVMMRYRRRWYEKQQLAREAGFTPSQVTMWERCRRPLPPGTLERTAEATDFPPYLLEPLRRGIRSFLAVSVGRSRPARVLGDVLSTELVPLVQQFMDAALEAASPAGHLHPDIMAAPAPEDRDKVVDVWARLEALEPSMAQVLVEEDEGYQAWPLCEAAAAKSIDVAGEDPRKALGWAELALFIAERVKGEPAWLWRLEAYSRIHVTNARKVCGELRGADRDLACLEKLWEAGTPGDPGLLNPAIFLGLVANVRRAQRRFPEALERLAEAMAADRGDLRARLLYTKAGILVGLGDTENATAALRETLPLIDAQREPRLALGVRFLFLRNLCLQGKAAEAERDMDDVRVVAERQGKQIDLLRVVWLQGAIAAGLGRREEARQHFEHVRREFDRRKIAFDYALVSLELALVLLEEGRTGEVRSLADEMYWIFSDQNVPENALAALRVFCAAARREKATAELAQRVVRYLYRAQHDPELRFEPET
jgi:tetratricopeptide (TPR) repeat protein